MNDTIDWINNPHLEDLNYKMPDEITYGMLEIFIENHMSKKNPEIVLTPYLFKVFLLTDFIAYIPTSKKFYFYDAFAKEYSKIRLISWPQCNITTRGFLRRIN